MIPKRTFVAAIIALLFASRLNAQATTQDITLYCKVWGFLKYHHPNVGNGTINWDSVFIAHIRDVTKTKTIAQLNAEVSTLISAAGAIANPQIAKLPADVFAGNHNLNWLQSTALTEQNRERLNFIYIHRNQRNNRFVSFKNYTDYSGENAYDDMVWPTEDYRLLFLARFWNAIEYFDPYKLLTVKKWDAVLPEYITKFRTVRDTITYQKLLMQLAVALHDGHAQLITKDDFWGRYTLPVYVAVINDTVVINHLGNDSLCRLANIRKGDIITSIDGEPIASRLARFKTYTTSSNTASLNRHLEQTLICTPDTLMRLTLKRGGKIFTTKVKTTPVSQRDWTYINYYTANETGYKAIGNNIAYIYTMQIWDKNIDTIKALIHSKKAVIFDARNYTQNDAFYNLFGMFLPHPTPINYNTFIMPDNPGYFHWGLSSKIGGDNTAPYSGQVIILADERCQSQGEYSVMALQTIPQAVTIGSQTSGADGVVSFIPMGGKLGITHSGYGIYYPDKTPTQQRGVRIDIPAKRTAKNVINNEDPALDAALKYLRGKGIE